MSVGAEGSTLVRAPAKVNLYLAVGSRRPDGYHNVDTVLQALTLADDVLITPACGLSVTTDPDIGLPAEDNLAFRAARALGVAIGREPHVAIRITKRIPAQAGLGGASTDAAAVLIGLAHRWGLGPSHTVLLHEVAAALGADVPFFLGPGTALFTSRGDELLRVLPTPDLHLALIKPPASVSTAQAYAAIDVRSAEAAPGPAAMVRACESGDALQVAAALYNDFTSVAMGLAPEVADALASVSNILGVLGAGVAGSGSAVFAVCADADTALAVTADGEARGWWACATTTARTGTLVTEGA